MDLALNNLQRLICHKTKQTKYIYIYIYIYIYMLRISKCVVASVLNCDIVVGTFEL